MLKLFTQTEVLRAIGHSRVGLFLEDFRAELGAVGIVLPTVPDTAYPTPPEPQGTEYFNAVAAIFAMGGRLPERLVDAMLKLEAAAAETDWLDATLLRRMPCLSINRDCALDRALNLWFVAREELEKAPNLKVRPHPGPLPQEREGCLGSTLSPLAGISGGEVPVSSAAGGATPPASSADGTTGNGAETEEEEETLGRLARMGAAQYDRVRKGAAKQLGLRVETLDREVAQRRAQMKEDENGRNVELPVIEPWPEPVDGAEVLDQVSKRFSLCVVLPPGGADAIALWTAHTHAFEAFFQTPRLNLYSPEAQCGKTTTMDVLACMTPRPLRTENLTAPTLLRIVEQFKPTLFLDEVDAYLSQAEELRGLLNAGHKRGACAYRCEGEGKAVRSFKAFAPAVLAGIGHLPATLHDRSIAVPLVKALPGEIKARFEEHRAEAERVLARKLARWARDHFEALKACEPGLPATAFNRVADNWRPLFAIAQVAGGGWPARAAAAFDHLVKDDVEMQGLGIRLLRDIREIFAESGAEKMRSKDLVRQLCAMTDGPWPEAHRGGKPITETWLGHRLRRFGVRSQMMRMGKKLARGYAREDFAEAWARFLG